MIPRIAALRHFAGGKAFPIFLAGIGIAVALAAAPFLAEMPNYLDDARRLAAGHGLPANNLTPVGYPLLLSPFVALFGDRGVLVVQAAAYAATVYVAWHILVGRLAPARQNTFVVAMVLIAFHPYLLFDIQRINDNAINILLVAVLCLWLLRHRMLERPLQAIGYGVAAGLFATIRPNAVVFALLPVAARVLGRNGVPGFRNLAMFYGAFAVVWMLVSAIATGNPLFWPSNGPYNLFAGNNPLAIDAELHRYNGEYSIDSALAYYGFAGADRYGIPGHVYIGLVGRYLREMPGQALELLAVKTMIFFGPRWAEAHDALRRIVQLVLVYPVIFWAWGLVREARAGTLSEVRLFLIFVLLFAAPFVLTNVDPRFRLPLDIAFLIYGFARIGDRAAAVGGGAPA